jgi:hypothetical protein
MCGNSAALTETTRLIAAARMGKALGIDPLKAKDKTHSAYSRAYMLTQRSKLRIVVYGFACEYVRAQN